MGLVHAKEPTDCMSLCTCVRSAGEGRRENKEEKGRENKEQEEEAVEEEEEKYQDDVGGRRWLDRWW